MSVSGEPAAPTLVVLGANPAWQRVLNVPGVLLDEVNRVQLAGKTTAGKGMNCARAATRMGAHCILLGGRGPQELDWDASCTAESVIPWSFSLEGPIRWAITLRDTQSHQVTELVEEGPAISEQGQHQLQAYLHELGQRALPIAVCGSLPRGLSPDDLAQSLRSHSALVWVDSLPLGKVYAKLPELCPQTWVCKLNAQEWSEILDHNKSSSLPELSTQWNAPCLVTRGPQPLEVYFPDGTYGAIPAPELGQTDIQPIGAGDTFSGAFLAAWLDETKRQDCLYHAVAAASASCLQALPGSFTPADQHTLFHAFASRSLKWPF